MQIRAVIFDMDGLMFDTERLGRQIDTEIEKDGKLRKIDIEDMRGLGMREIMQRLESVFDGEMETLHKVLLERERLMEEYISRYGLPVKEGLYALLEYLRQHQYRIALATSTPEKKALHYIRLANVEKYFDSFVFGDMVEHGKPNPEIFLKTAKLLSLSPSECLVLEDSPNGVRGALHGGFLTIMVPDLSEPEEELIPRLAAVCRTLNDVIPFLKAVNKE